MCVENVEKIKKKEKKESKNGENPLRVLWLAAGALFVLFLANFYPAKNIANQAICALLFYFSAGCALYLIMRRSIRLKVYAAGILALGSFYAAHTAAKAQVSRGDIVPKGTLFEPFMSHLIFCLVFSAIIFAVGLIFSLKIKENSRKKLILAGLVSAGAIIVYGLIRRAITASPIYEVQSDLFSYALIAVSLFLSLFASNILCNLKIHKNEPFGEKAITPFVLQIFFIMGFVASFVIFFSGILIASRAYGIYWIYENVRFIFTLLLPRIAFNIVLSIIFIVFGGGLFALQVFCAFACFVKNAKGAKRFFVMGLVFALVSMLLLAGMILGGVYILNNRVQY